MFHSPFISFPLAPCFAAGGSDLLIWLGAIVVLAVIVVFSW